MRECGLYPSKHLLAVEESTNRLKRQPYQGVRYDSQSATINWQTIREEKDALVLELREKNYINVAEHYGTDIYTGRGRLADEHTIEFTDGDHAGTAVTGDILLIAIGSSPQEPPVDGLKEVPCETSETILDREILPESMIILGGGFVAMEWRQILHRFGVEVTIVQRSGYVFSRLEEQLGRGLERYLIEEGNIVMQNAICQCTEIYQLRACSAGGFHRSRGRQRGPHRT